jgi:hypothetical protein
MSDEHNMDQPSAVSSSATCNTGLPLRQPSAASSVTSGLPLRQPSVASSATSASATSGDKRTSDDDRIGMVVVGVASTSPAPYLLPPLKAAVSPEETPTVDGRETPTVDGREASSSETSNWALIDGVARNPNDDSSSEVPNSPSSADHVSTGSWFIAYKAKSLETTKRKANALDEDFEKMTKDGRRSAFWTLDGVPLEQLPSDAAMEQPDSSS